MSRILALTICAGMVFAADAPRKVFPYTYDMHDYPNGLRLVTVPTDFPNVVSLYVVVQVGSRNEVEPGKSGFAHFFEHMMFRGTKKYPPEKFEAVLQEAGAASNAFTSDDLTAYHATFSKEDLERILEMEADRFQNLEYSEDVFKTEALAVLGEYNKNSAAPGSKVHEVLRNTAFNRHTYKHTTMGFLKDIQDMPNQYEYSKQFFDRYYRPEYATIIVAGDVQPKNVRALVAKHWGAWKRGSHRAQIAAEPPQSGARKEHIDWPSPTLPWVTIAFRGPAYSDVEKDYAALDIISFLGFSETSELHQKLAIEEQKVDSLGASNYGHVDPYLFDITSRVKNEKDMDEVRDRILSTLNGFKDTLVASAKLENVKRHLRYEFALSMNSSEAIADVLASYIALARTPETINRLYAAYDSITAEDLRRVARKYFVEDSRTLVTLTGRTAK